MLLCQTSSACFLSVASVSVAGVDIFLWQWASLLQRKGDSRRTGVLAVCWVLFLSVSIATVGLQWYRHGGGGGCYVIHEEWGWPRTAKAWQRDPTEPERKHLLDLGGLMRASAAPGCLPHCTSKRGTHILIPLNRCIAIKNVYLWC